MNTPTVRGTVHLVEETKSFGKSGFRKRLVVIEQESDRYTSYIPIEFLQDQCDTVNDLKPGMEIEIQYRLTGRRWQKDPQSEVKFFLSAEAQGFQVVGEAKSSGTEDANHKFAEASADDDDVPF